MILPSIVLLGLGFGLAFPAINVQAASGIADEEQGLVSGLLNTALQVGITVVLAASTAVIAANGGSTAQTNAQVLASYRPVLVFVAVATLGGLLILAGGLLRSRRTAVESTLTEELEDELDVLALRERDMMVG